MRVSFSLVLLTLTTLSLVFSLGCKGDTPASLEPVGDLQYINIFDAPISIRPGEVGSMTAIGYYPGNATYPITYNASWMSSNINVIEIIDKGIIRGVGGGHATITCSYRGVISQEILVFVEGQPIPGTEPPPPIVLTAIQVEPVFASVAVDNTEQFTATAVYSNGATQDVTMLSDWRVSDDNPGFIIDADNANAWGSYYGLFRATGPVGVTVVSCEYMGIVSNYVTVTVKEF